jgi:hypothetical protein
MKKMPGIIMMIAGVILVVAGYFVYTSQKGTSKAENIKEQLDAIAADGVISNREKEHVQKLASKYNLNNNDLIKEIEKRISESPNDAETEIINQSKKKGDDFEKFIAKKFNKKYYTIVQWAGDKYVDGVYSEKTLQPDIVVEFKLREESITIAVECKYRSKAGEKLKLSYKDQLERYRAYQKDSKVKVYMTVGVGGKASSPENLYLIPLDSLVTPEISVSALLAYKKEPGANFYYDVKSGELDISYPEK